MMILASGSPRRQELMRLVTPDFTVHVSEVDEAAIEAAIHDAGPAALAGRLAAAKCLAVAAECPGMLTLGCDTVVDWHGEVFGKPRDRDDARRMLLALSDGEHLVHTGLALARDSRIQCEVVTSRVHFLPIPPAELEAYLDTPEPYDKAGAYAIQGRAAVWCDAISGSYHNIMGLPVCQVSQLIKAFVHEEGTLLK